MSYERCETCGKVNSFPCPDCGQCVLLCCMCEYYAANGCGEIEYDDYAELGGEA
jgi:hypothetical protein